MLAVGLTSAGALSDGTWRDLLINLGASVSTVFLVALVLEPIIEQGRRPEELIHPDFPHQRYIDGVSSSSQRVRVMGAWPYVMDQQWRGDFLLALEKALERGVVAQILVLDPTSKAAEQRSLDLDNELRVSLVIADVLQTLSTFCQVMESNSSVGRLSVRVYNSLPPARLYRWDNRAISSFFPGGTGVGAEVRHYETNVTSSLGKFVDEQFDIVWGDDDTNDIQEYLSLSLKLLATGHEYLTPYIVLQNVLYVTSMEVVDSLFRNAVGEAEVHVTSRYRTEGMMRLNSFTLQTVPDNDPSAAAVCDLFARKYSGYTVVPSSMQGVLRLMKRDEAPPS